MNHDPHIDADIAIEIVHGLRTPAEAARAIEHAHACPNCDRHLREAAADRERFRARQAGVLGTAARGAAAAGPPSRRVARIGLAAAAAVLAVATTAILMRTPAPMQRPSPQLGLPPSSELVRLRAPGEESDLPRLEAAIALYDRGDYGLVAKRLETPFVAARFEPLRRLYRASALLELNRTEEAGEELAPIAAANLPAPYSDWRDWAVLRFSDHPADGARADSTLHVLANRPGPLRDRARAALAAASFSPVEPAP